MDLRQLVQQLPDWHKPQTDSQLDLQAELPPSKRKLIGPWRKNGRKIKPDGLDPISAPTLDRRRAHKRAWYWANKAKVLARLKAKRMELAEKSASV